MALVVVRVGYLGRHDTTVRGGEEVEFSEVKTPIVVEVPDPEGSLDRFKELVAGQGGSVVQVVFERDGVRAAVRVEAVKQTPLLQALQALGPVTRPAEGFRDASGNLVIVLRRR